VIGQTVRTTVDKRQLHADGLPDVRRSAILAAGAYFTRANADVAQLVEQRFRKPQVTGSNPVVGSSLRLERCGERRLPRRSNTEAGRP
jgi:hypothetical protein